MNATFLYHPHSAKIIEQSYWARKVANGNMNWARAIQMMTWTERENPFIRRATINVWK